MATDDRILQLEHLARSGDPVALLGATRAAAADGSDGSVLSTWVMVFDALARSEADDVREAQMLAERASIDARRHGNAALRRVASRVLAGILLARGDREGARIRFAESDHPTRPVTDPLRVADLVADRARLLFADGALVACEVAVADVVRIYDGAGERRAAVVALLLGAEVRRALGDRTGAVDALHAAHRRVAPEDEHLSVLVDGAFAATALDDGEPAEALRLARRALGRLGLALPGRRARLWTLVGLAHRGQNDREAAGVAFRRAAELLDGVGLPSDVPRGEEIDLLLAGAAWAEARTRLVDWTERLGPDADPARVAIVHALVLPSVVDARDWIAFAHHLRLATTLHGASAGPGGEASLRHSPGTLATAGPLDAIAARAVRRAGELCAAVPEGALSRAVRCRALSLALFGRLDRTDEALAEARALQELGTRGAPIPAGPFDLVRSIGRGATGEVWRGRHHDRRWPVAVKILSPEQNADRRFHALIAEEIRSVAALDHPNVVRVVGAGVLGPEAESVAQGAVRDESPWFAMELAEGGTLEALCGGLPWNQCRAILLSLLDALAHAHARGVVHLDLKPANVLLRSLPDGRRSVLLTDFGLSRLVARAAGRAQIAGTPQYMAPEQFRGESRDFGPWTDLYAFGCLAVHLLQGSPPFPGEGLEAQQAGHLDLPIQPLRARMPVPSEVRPWLERLLQKTPRDRYQRAADAAWGLRQLPENIEGLAAEFDDEGEPLSAMTVVLSIEEAPGSEPTPMPRILAEGGRLADRPPIPEDWRPPVPPRLDVDLADAALSLFAMRRPPLVGRDAERDRLWALLQEVVERGDPRVACIAGAPGSGKTALARWLCERAHELGAATIFDGAMGADGQHGLRAMVARHLHLEGLDPEEARVRVRAMVPALDDDVVEDLAILVAEHGVALSAAERVGCVAALVSAIAALRPVIVHVEPESPSSREGRLLVRVLSSVPAPVLVLCDLATGEVDPVLPSPSLVSLGPMSDAEVTALLDALVPLRPSLRARVVELAGGNPDLAVRLVADRIEQDALVAVDSGYDLRPGTRLALPDRLARTYADRIASVVPGLGGPERTALCAAAILGSTDRWDRVCAAAGDVDPVALVPKLGGLVRPLPDLGFAHPAIPLLLREGWADLAAAEVALAALEGQVVSPGLLGPLLLRAGRMAEAARPLLLGAEEAFEAGDLDRALDLADRRVELQRGLGHDPEGPDAVADALLRARIAWAAGRPFAELADRAVTLAENHAQVAAAAEARLLVAAAAHESGDDAPARKALRKALDGFLSVDDPVGAARVLCAGGDLARSAGDLEAAANLYKRAASRMAGRDDARIGALIHTGSAAVNLARGRPEEAETELLATLHAVRAAGAVSAESEVLCALGDTARTSGRSAAADARYRAALARVPWHDVRRVRAIQLRRIYLRLAAGRAGEAAGNLDGLLSGVHPDDRSPFVRMCRLVQVVLAVRRDDRTWENTLARAREAIVRIRDPDAAWLLEVAGRRACDLGRLARAEVTWQWSVQLYRALGRGPDVVRLERSLQTLTRADLGATRR